MTISSTELLSLSPLGIVISDLKGRITWCNDLFTERTGLKKNIVEGQVFASLPFETIDKEGFQVQQFDSSVHNAARYHYWLAKHPDGNSNIHYYMLDQSSISRIAKLSRAKLPKRPDWTQFLDYEISRSRRYDNPLCILKLQLLTENNPDDLSETTIYQSVKDTLLDCLRWADMISESKQGGFLMVLPETPLSSVTQLESKLSTSILSQLRFLSPYFKAKVIFGHSHWQKHDDAQKLIAKARSRLVENLENT